MLCAAGKFNVEQHPLSVDTHRKCLIRCVLSLRNPGGDGGKRSTRYRKALRAIESVRVKQKMNAFIVRNT